MTENNNDSSASIGESPEIKALCEEFKQLNPKFVAIKARLDFIKSKLTVLADGRHVLSSGVNIKTSERKGSIDYKSINGIKKMTESGSIEKYRKDSTFVTKIVIVG